MDNKDIAIIVATIAAVGLMFGLVMFNEGGDPSGGKDLVGEWKAYYVMGYDEDGNYITESEPALLEKYNFEVTSASNGLYLATRGSETIQGTYVDGKMTAKFSEGLSTTSFYGFLSDKSLFACTLMNAATGETSVMSIMYSHDGVRPPMKESDTKQGPILPTDWVMDYGISYNGSTTYLMGDNLKITEQKWPLMKGTMEQQVGSKMVVKDFVAIAEPTTVTSRPSTLILYRAVDDMGLDWTMSYNSKTEVLKANMTNKSEIYAGTTATQRLYGVPGGDVPDPKIFDYLGTTWKTDVINVIDENGDISKLNSTIVLNITSQKGTLLAGTMTLNDGTILDYSAITNPNGWSFANCKSPVTEAHGVVTIIDSSRVFVRAIYSVISADGTESWEATTYTLVKVEPEPANAFLGEWQCQYGQLVDENGEFKTETRSEGDLQKWDLNIQSVKGGMFIGTFGGESIVGSVPSNFLKSQVSPEVTLVASVDGKGNLQAHIMIINADGTSSMSNLVYTHGQSTTKTASTVDIRGVYDAVHAEKYDGNVVTKLGGTALNITEQQGTLFKGTMEVDIGGVKTVDVIGYTIGTRDFATGLMIIEGEISQITLSANGEISIVGITPANNVYARLYVPVGKEPSEPQEVVDLIGRWNNGESNQYSDDGNFSPNGGYEYYMEITKQNGIFVSGKVADLSFLGVADFIGDGAGLRMYYIDEVVLPYPVFASLYGDVGIRITTFPGLAVITSIEKA